MSPCAFPVSRTPLFLFCFGERVVTELTRLRFDSPQGHHPALRTRINAFHAALMATDPPIAGLHESVLVNPRRLHLTLGVMSLAGTGTGTGTSSDTPPQKTLYDACAFLRVLRPQILRELHGSPLRVPLTSMDIMKPERGNPERAHVLWAGPARPAEGTLDEEYARLERVSRLINSEFRRAGLVVDEHRPLKVTFPPSPNPDVRPQSCGSWFDRDLHCTLINTVYRKPRPSRGQRLPFSYPSVLASPAFGQIAPATAAGPVSAAATDTAPAVVRTSNQERTKQKGPVEVDLGTWTVDEVQICEMGSQGPEGEYVCVGRISLPC
ncbi:hypothetical protein PUNSTDRAFT_130426 [Punctularia strigosozonata HHB-11173 SS5]|uniref:uncharacterized protein n=1 Tax=Punctularia strigosozonata (strain HHB-11173) TaxID=741275 RepID=UPI0004417CF8|nr:uncharacterized protein PUNSTDRAFT_130426 [Punctularia strigosozonata HHB-11173 SS5]EIN12157.1 hypothetical protein PUNSTDRAFT_130426 [Punctularia strigosozonata HHB-11173 SS5]